MAPVDTAEHFQDYGSKLNEYLYIYCNQLAYPKHLPVYFFNSEDDNSSWVAHATDDHIELILRASFDLKLDFLLDNEASLNNSTDYTLHCYDQTRWSYDVVISQFACLALANRNSLRQFAEGVCSSCGFMSGIIVSNQIVMCGVPEVSGRAIRLLAAIAKTLIPALQYPSWHRFRICSSRDF